MHNFKRGDYVMAVAYKFSPPKYEYGRDVDGYGRKICTDHMVKLEGDSRWRRVYCTCFSNSGTHWIVVNGVEFIIPENLQELVDKH